MPKTTKGGQPKSGELPGTLKRSNAKAQRTFAAAHDAGADQYGSEERAHRVAYAALNAASKRSATVGCPRKRVDPRMRALSGAVCTTRFRPTKASTPTPAKSICSTSRASSTFPADPRWISRSWLRRSRNTTARREADERRRWGAMKVGHARPRARSAIQNHRRW